MAVKRGEAEDGVEVAAHENQPTVGCECSSLHLVEVDWSRANPDVIIGPVGEGDRIVGPDKGRMSVVARIKSAGYGVDGAPREKVVIRKLGSLFPLL